MTHLFAGTNDRKHAVKKVVAPFGIEPNASVFKRRKNMRVVDVGLRNQHRRSCRLTRPFLDCLAHFGHDVRLAFILDAMNRIDPQPIEVVFLDTNELRWR